MSLDNFGQMLYGVEVGHLKYMHIILLFYQLRKAKTGKKHKLYFNANRKIRETKFIRKLKINNETATFGSVNLDNISKIEKNAMPAANAILIIYK